MIEVLALALMATASLVEAGHTLVSLVLAVNLAPLVAAAPLALAARNGLAQAELHPAPARTVHQAPVEVHQAEAHWADTVHQAEMMKVQADTEQADAEDHQVETEEPHLA